MSVDFRNSIFKITGSKENTFGTSFIIHKDSQHSYFLTCQHVITNIGGKKDLKINDEAAELVYSDSAANFDLAILRVNKVFSQLLIPIKLTNLAIESTELSGYGFSQASGQIIIENFTCVVDKEAQVTSNGGKIREKAWWIKTKSDTHLKHGFSGSPIINSSGQAIGFVNQKKGTGKEGLVISLGTILHVWKDNCPFENAAVKNRLKKYDSSLINFKSEISILDKILEAKDKVTKLIALKGGSGMGKSRLIREYLKLIENSDHKMRLIDLKEPITPEEIIDRITSDLGEANFTDYLDFVLEKRPDTLTREKEKQWNKSINRKFFASLFNLKPISPYFLIFDHFERADRELREWLSKQFLEKNTSSSNIMVIIGGQESPSMSFEEKHRKCFNITSIPLDNYHEYIEENNISIDIDIFNLVHDACNGSPSQLITFIQKQQNG